VKVLADCVLEFRLDLELVKGAPSAAREFHSAPCTLDFNGIKGKYTLLVEWVSGIPED